MENATQLSPPPETELTPEEAVERIPQQIETLRPGLRPATAGHLRIRDQEFIPTGRRVHPYGSDC